MKRRKHAKEKSKTSAREVRLRRAGTSAPSDLRNGVIVILSGGAVDGMNPVEVRERMDEYVSAVNDDPFVKASSDGKGLTYKLFDNQKTKRLHQSRWRAICDVLSRREATPLIIVGHSNGGAAAMDLSRCLQSQDKVVDLLFTADSVLTLDDIGDIYEVPSNVRLNINTYVIPTPAWLLAPFPIGRSNRRQVDGSLDGVLNVGLRYNLPGALGHRNAFYDLAGGDKHDNGTYSYPFSLLESSLASLRGEPTTK
jgi:hypothetical protein